MSDDLVKRLLEPSFDTFLGPIVEPIKMEAADRIEKLEAALRWYANDDQYRQIWDDQFRTWVTDVLSDNGRRARAALKGKKDE